MNVIRPLTEISPRLAQIHASAFDWGWSEADFLDLMQRPFHHILGLYRDDDLLSFVVYSHVVGEAEILTLATDARYRRQGLACALMQQLIAHLKAENGESLFLEVAVDNPAALQLYARLGFCQSDVRKAYYNRRSGPPVDGYILRLCFKNA